MARDPKRLEVFHQAHRLALEIYVLTAGFPPEERFGLQSQLRRALLELSGSLQLLEGERPKQCRECSDHLFRALQKLHTAVSSMPN
jgi:four helix bundle protein